eukprot:CAMPEP_0184383512 /NCGR_PEP_ID=MMETSP0007-20130409/7203_1 /TAXON_ID=97485 /ORGANISM="Prymnesium parvum, Strain Texoma1" /LENGTH=127 /DNA_ID=CAMNT_0026730029 /DNA_START=291 /DNA_END=672 /DNA_ORIENTATION=-
MQASLAPERSHVGPKSRTSEGESALREQVDVEVLDDCDAQESTSEADAIEVQREDRRKTSSSTRLVTFLMLINDTGEPAALAGQSTLIGPVAGSLLYISRTSTSVPSSSCSICFCICLHASRTLGSK